MNLRPGRYSTASSRPRLTTMENPARRARISSASCRGKLSISYIVSQPELGTRKSSGRWKAVMKTINWRRPAVPNRRRGDVCCSVGCCISACLRERNNENSDVPVDEREQLYWVAQQCQTVFFSAVTRVFSLLFKNGSRLIYSLVCVFKRDN
jgi:hypothetical protein